MSGNLKDLNTYDDWKHCIIEICKVPPTYEFVAKRLEELRRPDDFNNRKFVSS